MHRLTRLVLPLTITALVAACSADSSAPAKPTSSQPQATSGGPTQPGPGSSASSTGPQPSPRGFRGRWRHVVIVMEENHGFLEVNSSRQAPYMNKLASQGIWFSHSHAVTHPSQPNYIALFSGSVQGVHSDDCPNRLPANNLAHQLLAHRYTFAGYSEQLPRQGSKACYNGQYGRKHAPWTNFPNVPRRVDKPFSAFPKNYRRLPTVSFVIPNLNHDMHDGTIRQADTWLKKHIGSYARWARKHQSLLIVDWDEDDYGPTNHIPTFAVGAGVRAGYYAGQQINHYNMLRTLEDAYKLPPLGHAAHAKGIVRLGG